MFDTAGAFTKQFTRVEGGYLFYPSPRSGGKLITIDEYDRLSADWNRVAGSAGGWKIVGLVLVALTLWTLVEQAASLPDWAGTLFIALVAVAVCAFLSWSAFAPGRLVRNRPAIAPPRPASDVQREARALLNWPSILIALLFSAGICLGLLAMPDRTPGIWAWIAGSGLMCCTSLWVGFSKLKDRRG